MSKTKGFPINMTHDHRINYHFGAQPLNSALRVIFKMQRARLLSSAVQYTIPVFLPNSVVDGTVSDDTLRWNSVHPHDTDQWKSTEDQ